MPSRIFPAALAVALAALAACSDDGGGRPEHAPAAPSADPDGPVDFSPEALRERPWEVVSKKGETYLESVFYADPIENEQIMPYAIDGRAQIDRMIYPTLGNPNLYVKTDAEDELV